MTLLFHADYELAPDGSTLAPPWREEQEPAYNDPGADRITVVAPADLPGDGRYKPTTPAMRVELHPWSATNPGQETPSDGDVQDSSGFLANRAEVLARNPEGSWGGTPPAAWPDPVGVVRWYGYSLLVPADFTTTENGTLWLTMTQWKGLYGGSPPVGVEIKRSSLRLGGTRTNSGLIPGDGTMGPLTPGTWARIVVGMKLSPDPAEGWVTAYLNGEQVVPQTTVATMDYQGDGITPDPIYLKQGIYRAHEWDVPHVLYFGPTKVGETSDDVGLAMSPPPVPAGSALGEHWGQVA